MLKQWCLSPEVQLLLERAIGLYAIHQPTSAAMNGLAYTERIENLSDDGLDEWASVLAQIEADLSSIEQSRRPLIDAVVLSELRRFVSEQKFKHVEVSPFRRIARAYLDMVSLILSRCSLGLAASAEVKDMQDLESALVKCLSVLQHGTLRLTKCQLVVTANDRTRATKLGQTLDLTCTSAPLSSLIQSLKSILELWAHAPDCQPHRRTGTFTLELYLERIVGLKQAITDIAERLHEASAAEVADFLKSRPFLAVDAIHDHQTDLDIHDLATLLGTCVSGRILKRCSPTPIIQIVPNVLEDQVTDSALIETGLQTANVHSRYRVLVPRSFLEGHQANSAKLLGHAAVQLAHEICPGHYEQLVRARSSPLTLLYYLTRSPITFEGWAVWSERCVLYLEGALDSVRYAFHFNRMRRFIGAIRFLRGRNALYGGVSRLERILADLPATERTVLMDVTRLPHLGILLYCLGELEITDLIDCLLSTYKKTAFDSEVFEHLLSVGPVCPIHLREILTQHLE